MKNTKYYKMLTLAFFALWLTGCKKTGQDVENICAIVDKIVYADGIQKEIDLKLENNLDLVLLRRDYFRHEGKVASSKCLVGDTVYVRYDKKTNTYDNVSMKSRDFGRLRNMNNFLIKQRCKQR